MLIQKLRENADQVRRTGEYALKVAREAGVPAYYSDPSIGAGIIKEMPDGSRFRIAVSGDEDAVLETLAPRRCVSSAREPHCTILGGPNGSGKSSLYERLKPDGMFVNADVVARRISPVAPESVSLAAGREVITTLERHVEARRSFVYETTLSSKQALDVMRASKAAGYVVALAFITLDTPDLNVRRVAERVMRGGHDIPEQVVRRRYEAAFRRLPTAISLADDVVVVDNSKLEPVTLLEIERGSIIGQSLEQADPFHARIAEAVADGLRLSLDAVFMTGRHG